MPTIKIPEKTTNKVIEVHPGIAGIKFNIFNEKIALPIKVRNNKAEKIPITTLTKIKSAKTDNEPYAWTNSDEKFILELP